MYFVHSEYEIQCVNIITVLASQSCCLLYPITKQESFLATICQQYTNCAQYMYVKVLVHTNIFHLKSEHVSVNMPTLDIQFIVNIKSQNAERCLF